MYVTVPHTPLRNTSTRPSNSEFPPTRRTFGDALVPSGENHDHRVIVLKTSINGQTSLWPVSSLVSNVI